ncbi:uncharacterized protein [Battus philenor]|uniref:uncharacterized protein n=1 Tax=Battus philenor TaxID=42288 RepID=UPI0035CF1625
MGKLILKPTYLSRKLRGKLTCTPRHNRTGTGFRAGAAAALLITLSDKTTSSVLLITLQIASSAKTNASPVYEVINEQPKADDKLIKTSAVSSLPYGNPLAGNSQQNAKLYAHNQQAMFNAERVRQHKAQLQRWIKTPHLADSYMRAYHESQESHQLALEQQQSELNDNKPKQAQRKETPKRSKVQSDLKTIKSDVSKTDKKRIHRSYGSVGYETVYVPSTSQFTGQITPNVINEMTHNYYPKLYPDSATNPEIYTKYYPEKDYQSIQDIETLNSLLNKNPGEQLTKFNALINSGNNHNENHDRELETPIDLYFYLKGPANLASHEVYPKYAPLPRIRKTNSDDYKPIKEDDKEISETPKYNTQAQPDNPSQYDATKDIRYINTELTNQIISAGYNPLYHEDEYTLKEDKPSHQALQYGQQPTAYYSLDDDKSDEDLNERYLQHNANKGVQHLTHTGSGVSAYDDENVSINFDSNVFNTSLRFKRSLLETNPFILSRENETDTNAFSDISRNRTEIPKAESLIRTQFNPKYKRTTNYGTFLTTPNFPIGEAIDYREDYENMPRIFERPNYGAQEFVYDENDYNYNDDLASFDYDYEIPSHKSIKQSISIPNHKFRSFEMYAPSENYGQNINFKSYTKYRPFKRFPDVSTTIGPIYSSNNFAISPHTSYGINQNYETPDSYNVPQTKFNIPNVPHLSEPVYMLTQTQLAKLIGHHNLNIEHLDVFQLPKGKRTRYPGKFKKFSTRNRGVRNILKLHKLHALQYAASYEFGYRVRDTHSGNDFGHQEEKKGEETSGHYHVLLPDGRMQNVRYSAGPEGFHADISYGHQ